MTKSSFTQRFKAAWRAFHSPDDVLDVNQGISGNKTSRQHQKDQTTLSRRSLITGSGLAVAAGAFIASMQPRQAHAAMTVFDPSNLAKNAETAAQTAQLVLSNKGILTMAEDTLKKIGMGGISTDMASKLLDASGGILSAIGHVKDVQGAGRMLMQSIQIGDGGGGADTLSGAVSTAHQFVLMAPPANSMLGGDRTQFDQMRKTALVSSQGEALGAAIYHSQDAANAAQRIQKVADQAKNTGGPSGDMRSQLATLTSAVLMMVEEQAKGRQLHAASVGQMAIEGQLQVSTVGAPTTWSNPDAPTDGGSASGSGAASSQVFSSPPPAQSPNYRNPGSYTLPNGTKVETRRIPIP